ncbi:hypothetical protein OSB04_017683 [Centaurea solstitialis]|uniref:Uncharacterized protein n=1 Tax=Centaurea solstitialis TaxID=347529 RepID=A0AA38TAX1_9ASTR|nr:hypothetical protein OSB04_017683 [Centaurea solstitialis]
MPVIIFAVLQFPVLVDMFRSMYDSRYLFKPKKPMLYNTNPRSLSHSDKFNTSLFASSCSRAAQEFQLLSELKHKQTSNITAVHKDKCSIASCCRRYMCSPELHLGFCRVSLFPQQPWDFGCFSNDGDETEMAKEMKRSRQYIDERR